VNRLRPHLTFANVAVVLLLAFGFTPLGHATAVAADGMTAQVAKALKLSKSADKRSKKALAKAKQALEKGGPAGPAGPVGPPGPAGSPDTAPQVLGKLLGVDGASSGLDADLLDGLDSSTFARSASIKSGFVAPNGVLFNGTPGVTASRNSVGSYRLDLGSINGLCAVSVTAEDEFSFVRLGFQGTLEGWDVEFADTAGVLADRAFDFVAVCRESTWAPARGTTER
jgi:hypothetical protein